MALTLPSAIPTSACIGSLATTATWTSSSFWNQWGASWELTLSDPSLVFNGFSIPGAGAGHDGQQDPNLAAQKALAMNKDKKTLTLSVPYPTLGGSWDIVIRHGPSSLINSVMTSSIAPEATGSQQAQKQVILLIKAKVPCLDPGVASHSSAHPGNPTVASSCSNNQITAGPEAWKTYEVPNVVGAAVIHRDVNPPGPKCTYTAKCDSISCKDVRDSTVGSQESVQRYLAYQAVVNLNNYLRSCYDALYKAGTTQSLKSGEIVTTFFSSSTPEVTWVQYLGGITPLLDFASTYTAPLLVPSAGFGLASGLAGLVVGQATMETLSAVVDRRFSEYSSITSFVADYMEKIRAGIGNAYQSTLGPSTSIYEWTGLSNNPGNKNDLGIFGDGFFSNSDLIQDMSSHLLSNMIKIFTYKAINFAWTDAGVFVMFVPYNRDIMGPDGNIIHNFNSDYCKNKLYKKELVEKIINCDAGGGMAALLNAANGGSSGVLSTPQGYDTPFNVLSDYVFSVMGAIEGSVASWRKVTSNMTLEIPTKTLSTVGIYPTIKCERSQR
ncbi:MAG: hypothetical protein M1836_000503 [Candelina mexicana]|nr:MAG: hypothetical protein M1836_000503 [Candelina mexicana]